MEAIVSLMALVGMGVAAFAGIKWMLKNGHLNPQKEQPLTPNDLRVLEESAARLIADLRAVTDECVARIETACVEAERRISTLDDHCSIECVDLHTHQVPAVGYAAPTPVAPSVMGVVEPAAEVARQSGMTTGEVELLRGLESLSTS